MTTIEQEDFDQPIDLFATNGLVTLQNKKNDTTKCTYCT